MNNWEIMSPRAQVGFKPGPGAAALQAELVKVPGVKRRRAGWMVPYNAVKVVAKLSERFGVDLAYAKWEEHPPPQVTWKHVERVLRAGGEMREWVLDGFLTQYQMDATAFGWPKAGVHFWHSTGSGKTLTGIMTALSVPGPVIVVTRASARLQFSREIERFTTIKPYVIRPEGERRGLMTVQGQTWVDFFKQWMPELGKAALVAKKWAEAKASHGVLVKKGSNLQDYLDECKEKKVRPIIVVGWESLANHLESLKEVRAASAIFDELHQGKGSKRWQVVPLGDPEGDTPGEKLGHIQKMTKDAKKQGGFVKQTDEGMKMFLPVMNRAAAAATLARWVRKRIGTTATPIKDRVRDLWSQLDIIEPNAHGNKTTWENRHCLVPETRVLMGDGSYKPIGTIQEGDVVIGWSRRGGKRFLHRTPVVWAGRRKAEVVQLRLESGKTIRCTPDHHWLNLWSPHAKIKYKPTYRAVGYTPTGWVRGVNHLQPVGFEPPKTNFATVGYKLGYIRGLLDGDGHMRIQKDLYSPTTGWGKARRRKNWRSGKPKKYQATIFSAERPHLERALHFAREIGLPTSGIKPRTNPEGWTLGFYSKEAYRRLSTSRGGTSSLGYKAGWLAGMYDAEGSRAVISQHRRVNPDNFRLLQKWLELFGFSSSEVRDKRHDDAVGVRLLGGRVELLRFFGLTRPVFKRKLDAAFRVAPCFRQAQQPLDKVKTAFRLKGLREVVSIQTSTGNYIAEGFGSKNCDRKPGTYGGYDTRGKSNLGELQMRLEDVAHVLTYAETHAQLPPKRRQSVYIAPEDQCRPTGGFAKERKDAQKRGATAVLEVGLAEAASRKRPAVLGLVEDHVRDGQKVVCFTGRRRDCEALGKSVKATSAVKSAKVQVWVAHGGQSQKLRDQLVQDYMAHPGPCVLVGTGHAFGESLNIDDTDSAMFVMLPYTPGQLRQWEGRFHRASTKKPVIIYYVIAEGTVDEHMAAILIDKLPAVEQIAQDTELGEAKDVLAGYDPNESEEEFAASVLADLDFG